MKCKCGNEFDTAFCPQCGEMTGNSLLTLIQHCNTIILQKRTIREKYYTGERKTKPDQKELKWVGWRDALLQLIEENKDVGSVKTKR